MKHTHPSKKHVRPSTRKAHPLLRPVSKEMSAAVILGCAMLFLGVVMIKATENSAPESSPSVATSVCPVPQSFPAKAGCETICYQKTDGCGACEQVCGVNRAAAPVETAKPLPSEVVKRSADKSLSKEEEKAVAERKDDRKDMVVVKQDAPAKALAKDDGKKDGEEEKKEEGKNDGEKDDKKPMAVAKVSSNSSEKAVAKDDGKAKTQVVAQKSSSSAKNTDPRARARFEAMKRAAPQLAKKPVSDKKVVAETADSTKKSDR